MEDGLLDGRGIMEMISGLEILRLRAEPVPF